MGHTRLLFLYFRLFNTQLTVNKCSNRGPLVLEATALPTEPQQLPHLATCLTCGNIVVIRHATALTQLMLNRVKQDWSRDIL